jgi:hypothetical protein
MDLHSNSPLLTNINSSDGSGYVPYAAWNDAIAEYFFNPSKSGQPVYLQIDTETIQVIGHHLGVEPIKAETNFLRAVRSHLFDTVPHARNINIDAKFLPRAGRPPRFIGVLALCVLAASRMERDEDLGVSAANYYRRLNELLRLEREGRPPWFDDTVNAWQRLEEWLHVVHQGGYGIATAKPINPSHPYVGYPQSQCLLRAADRQQLPAFFRWARLQPGDMPSREWLFAMLCEWTAHPRCPLSPQAKWRILEAVDAVRDAILAIVALELQTWDEAKEPVEESAMRGASTLLHLTVHSLQQRVSWYNYHDDVLTPLSGAPTWIACGTPTVDDAVLVFGDHPDIGQWTLLPRILLGRMHMILVHESEAERIRTWLTRNARPSWVEQQLYGIPKHWHCFRGVELLCADPHATWPSLRLHDNVTVRFQGGLLLDRDVYLTGFEPTVVLDGPESVTSVTVDGQMLPGHGGGQTTIALADYALPPGFHTLIVGSRTRSFITRDPHRPPMPVPTMPSIAHVFRRTNDGYVPTSIGATAITSTSPSSHTVYLSGAVLYGNLNDLPGGLPHTLVVRDGYKGYIVLGRQPGEIVEVRNTFVDRKHMLAARERSVAITVPFEPQWLITISRRKRSLTALHPTVPSPSTTPVDTQEQVEAWASAVTRTFYNTRLTPVQRKAWSAYTAVAERLKTV